MHELDYHSDTTLNFAGFLNDPMILSIDSLGPLLLTWIKFKLSMDK